MGLIKGNMELLNLAAKAVIAGDITESTKKDVWLSCSQIIESSRAEIHRLGTAHRLTGVGGNYYIGKLSSLESWLSALFHEYKLDDFESVKMRAPDNYYHDLYLIANCERRDDGF